jgi:endonuclease YncB( thermonuclease family)
MKTFLTSIFLVFIFNTTEECVGARFNGQVVEVTEGDLVVIEHSKNAFQIFRLIGVDAPRKGQPYFEESRRFLERSLINKKVQVEWYPPDNSCRKGSPECLPFAKIMFKGEDINLRQVKQGNAWHNKPLAREQSTTDRTLYAEAEALAKKRKFGLWNKKNPIAPWEFDAAKEEKKNNATGLPKKKSQSNLKQKRGIAALQKEKTVLPKKNKKPAHKPSETNR